MGADALANLVALIEDEEARKQAVALFEKSPKFKQEIIDRGLRQSDYDRNMNEWKKKVEEADKNKKEWQDWYDRNSVVFDTTVKEKETLTKQVEEMRAKVQ